MGGPFGEPHVLGGGGWMAWYAKATRTTKNNAAIFIAIFQCRKPEGRRVKRESFHWLFMVTLMTVLCDSFKERLCFQCS